MLELAFLTAFYVVGVAGWVFAGINRRRASQWQAAYEEEVDGHAQTLLRLGDRLDQQTTNLREATTNAGQQGTPADHRPWRRGGAVEDHNAGFIAAANADRKPEAGS